MNPFIYVACKARNKEFPQAGDAQAYYASDAFVERTRFKGAEASEDAVKVLVHLLSLVSLDPRRSQMMQDDLSRGLVQLDFFGYCNPVPMFTLSVCSPLMTALQKAVHDNVNSSLFDAAKRVLKWRTSAKVNLRGRQEDRVCNSFRELLTWPVKADFDANREQAQALMELLGAQVREKRASVRDRRNTRLAKLSQAATRVPGYQDLLNDIAISVLTPKH